MARKPPWNIEGPSSAICRTNWRRRSNAAGRRPLPIGVSAEVDLTSGDQSEETFDPQKSVMVTSQKTEDGPALTRLRACPELPPTCHVRHPGRRQDRATMRARRRTSVSNPAAVVSTRACARRREKTLAFGAGRSRAALEGAGDKAKKIVEPPSAEKLKVIKDLVRATAGLDTARGDQLVVEAFPSESTLTAQPVDLARRDDPRAPPLRCQWLAKLLSERRFRVSRDWCGRGVAAGWMFFAMACG